MLAKSFVGHQMDFVYFMCDALPPPEMSRHIFMYWSFNLIAGLLTSDASKALHASGILKELIQDHVDQECLIGKDPCLDDCNLESIEVQAIKSTCGVFEDVLNSYDGDLGKYIIDVISDLFLKLGSFPVFTSYFINLNF